MGRRLWFSLFGGTGSLISRVLMLRTGVCSLNFRGAVATNVLHLGHGALLSLAFLLLKITVIEICRESLVLVKFTPNLQFRLLSKPGPVAQC